MPDSGAGSVPDVSAAATDVATHAPFMDGEIITLTVNTAPVGGIAIIPWLVPLALRHNTVPIGKG